MTSTFVFTCLRSCIPVYSGNGVDAEQRTRKVAAVETRAKLMEALERNEGGGLEIGATPLIRQLRCHLLPQGEKEGFYLYFPSPLAGEGGAEGVG